jgi:hypothetical protein
MNGHRSAVALGRMASVVIAILVSAACRLTKCERLPWPALRLWYTFGLNMLVFSRLNANFFTNRRLSGQLGLVKFYPLLSPNPRVWKNNVFQNNTLCKVVIKLCLHIS